MQCFCRALALVVLFCLPHGIRGENLSAETQPPRWYKKFINYPSSRGCLYTKGGFDWAWCTGRIGLEILKSQQHVDSSVRTGTGIGWQPCPKMSIDDQCGHPKRHLGDHIYVPCTVNVDIIPLLGLSLLLGGRLGYMFRDPEIRESIPSGFSYGLIGGLGIDIAPLGLCSELFVNYNNDLSALCFRVGVDLFRWYTILMED